MQRYIHMYTNNQRTDANSQVSVVPNYSNHFCSLLLAQSDGTTDILEYQINSTRYTVLTVDLR